MKEKRKKDRVKNKKFYRKTLKLYKKVCEANKDRNI